MDKTQLSEMDIISKFVFPCIDQTGWSSMTQILQEVKLRDGKVIVTKINELFTLCYKLKERLPIANKPNYSLPIH